MNHYSDVSSAYQQYVVRMQAHFEKLSEILVDFGEALDGLALPTPMVLLDDKEFFEQVRNPSYE